MKRYLVLVLVAAIIIPACAQDTAPYRSIKPDAAVKLLAENPAALLVDVRTPEENRTLRIPGGVLLPDYDITARAEQVLPDKDAPIILYCRSGNRSRNASWRLRQMGYTRVYDLGGIQSWPFATERGQ